MATKPVKRIKLSSKGTKKTVASGEQPVTKVSSKGSSKKRSKKVLNAASAPAVNTAGYFKGSWQELEKVRWPNRRSTWALTLAVLLFSFFYLIIILLLDTGFQLLFKEVILK